MKEAIHLSVEDGISFEAFRSRLEGYADGVAAAVACAVEVRLQQLQRRQPEPQPVEPPKGE